MFAITGYHLFIEFFFGLGEFKEETKVMLGDFFQNILDLFPNSEFATVSYAGLAYISGNFRETERMMNTFVCETSSLQSSLQGVKFICLYKKVWLSTILGNWSDSLESSRILKEECKWSRALFCYIYAVYASMVIKDGKIKEIDCPPGLEESMVDALKDVPRVKRHFGGKMALHEKMVVEKSREFLEDPSKMMLPHLDFMYLWKIFSIASMNKQCISLTKESIDTELTNLSNSDDNQGLLSYLTFMRGVCESVSGEVTTARKSFLDVIGNGFEKKSYKHLIPQSYFELGMLSR